MKRSIISLLVVVLVVAAVGYAVMRSRILDYRDSKNAAPTKPPAAIFIDPETNPVKTTAPLNPSGAAASPTPTPVPATPEPIPTPPFAEVINLAAADLRHDGSLLQIVLAKQNQPGRPEDSECFTLMLFEADEDPAGDISGVKAVWQSSTMSGDSLESYTWLLTTIDDEVYLMQYSPHVSVDLPLCAFWLFSLDGDGNELELISIEVDLTLYYNGTPDLTKAEREQLETFVVSANEYFEQSVLLVTSDAHVINGCELAAGSNGATISGGISGKHKMIADGTIVYSLAEATYHESYADGAAQTALLVAGQVDLP